MHIEVLVEDSSGAKLIDMLLPPTIGRQGAPHTWRVHAYKGIGRLPAGLSNKADPAKRVLLAQLPRLLTGYGKTPGIDAVGGVDRPVDGHRAQPVTGFPQISRRASAHSCVMR